MNSLEGFSRPRRAPAVEEISEEKSASCCTRPMKDLSSVMFVGAGKSVIAVTLPGSTCLPSDDTLKPQYDTSFSAQQNFFSFSVI